MLTKSKIFLLILCFVYCFLETDAADRCTLVSGKQGVCLKLNKCPEAIQIMINGSFPPICGYKGTVPKVCCNQKRIPGEISKKKCKEYSEYVYEMIDVLPLIGAKPFKLYNCPIETIPLVVGGEKAGPKEFPHMALLGYTINSDIRWDCGGSIISENFILTAGHCLSHPRTLSPPKYAAIGFVDKRNSTGQIVRILEVISNYDKTQLYDDIGLLKVETMRMNSYVRPACLNVNYNFRTNRAIATGWGNVGRNGPSDVLLKVNLDIFSNEECNQKYKSAKKLHRGIDDDSQICAGSNVEIKDTCKGDSGGPLQIYHNSNQDGIKCMYDIVGITSLGKACGSELGSPGVYTRVSKYIKWIEETVWPDN